MTLLPNKSFSFLNFEVEGLNWTQVETSVFGDEKSSKIFCHTAQIFGLLRTNLKYFALCQSRQNHLIKYSSNEGHSEDTDSFTDHLLSISWIHLIILMLLFAATVSNYILYRKEKLVQRRNKGARLLYLTSIAVDIFYCAQAILYTSIYIVRSIIGKDSSLSEECFLMTLNAFSLKLVFISNLVMVITRFLAIFFPFWFVVRINLNSARNLIVTFFLISSSESFVIIGYCTFDALEMVTNIYWAISTVSIIIFIVFCNAGLLLFSHFMFRRQRRKIYKRNGTYKLYKNLTKTKAAIQTMGVLAIGVAGFQSESFTQLASPQRQHVKIHCFKEHEDKKKVKKLLLFTSISYLILVLPHFVIQIVAHFRIFDNFIEWKWAWRCSLLLLQIRFLINPGLYLFNRVCKRRLENKRKEITRKFSTSRL